MIDITPCLHVANEEYWIHYVLRDLLRVFGRAIMIDTGSTDSTVEIARETAVDSGAELVLILEDMRGDRHRIGQCPTRLRQMAQTDWMLLVDGDEIWSEPELRALLEMPEEVYAGKQVGFVNGRTVDVRDGRLVERPGMCADRLFYRDVVWDKRTDYPFQSHGLEARIAAGKTFYTNFHSSYYWHVRHLRRSSKDEEAYFRVRKANYFPYSGSVWELPADWIKNVNHRYYNPYLVVC